jgi:hypothetical protein
VINHVAHLETKRAPVMPGAGIKGRRMTTGKGDSIGGSEVRANSILLESL